jgi:hypothetical protein
VRTGETCFLPAGFQTRDHASWPFEVDLKADRATCVVLLAAAIAVPAASLAQQPSQPLTPGIPVTPDGQKGGDIPTTPPIPDTSKRTISTPAEKPIAPAQQPPARPAQ